MTDQPIHVFLVDDHEIVLRGLAGLLDGEEDIMVVGQATTAQEAIARINATGPDVVLLDVRLPDASGIEVCREVLSFNPNLAVLMVTSFSDDEAELAAVMAGACGYFLKDIAADSLIDSIHRAADGQVLVDREAVASRAAAAEPDPRWESLSPQERRVLELIGQGMTNRQIGETMFLSEKTVKHYVGSLLRKLDMQRRTQAASFITRLQDEGLVPGTGSTT